MTPEQLIDITANIEAHIERRAQEIAEPRIAEAEAAANSRVAEVERVAAFEEQRSRDLVAELRRHIAALERQVRRGGQP